MRRWRMYGVLFSKLPVYGHFTDYFCLRNRKHGDVQLYDATMAMLPQSSSLPSPSAKFTDNSNQRTRLSSDTGVPDSAKLNDIANSNIGAGTAVDQQSFRSDASVASTKFTDSTKRHVWQLMGHQCWICQSSAPLDIAHVLGQADKFVFRRCVTNNIISFKELSDFRNAIPLCPTCYKSYDLPIPRVFFLPTHVKFFFDWEEEDRKRRILFKQKHNEYCARRCPTEEIVSNDVYFLHSGRLPVGIIWNVYWAAHHHFVRNELVLVKLLL